MVGFVPRPMSHLSIVEHGELMKEVTSFKKISSLSAKSFNDQKAMIKKVLAGREVYCNTCNGLLKFNFPVESDAETEGSDRGGIHCDKGCTDLALDFSR